MSIDQFVYGYVANEETYPDKSVIIEEGSKGDWVYVILEGRAKVRRKTTKGVVTLDTLKEGDIFGEMVLLTTGQEFRSATVMAEGAIRLGVLDSERLVKDYGTLSPQLRALFRSLIRRLKDATDTVCNMVVESAQ
ncbi:MAG: cyclic nucleotide-binding domain-containing protein [Desulfatiglandaceae bacterium]|jgi:CRP-like cAMP-binding protein